MKLLYGTVRPNVFANDNDAFVPEIWAQESLMVLEANMVVANLVHRDFENEIARFGDVVNTRKPAAFEAKRKTDTDSVTVQDATVTNVAVTLNQHLHTSFTIKDGEESKGFANLRDYYLTPALQSIAQAIDQILLTQCYQFMGNAVGKLGTAADKALIISARELMNTKKVPLIGRNLIVTSNTEGDLLNIADFVNAEKVGDNGSALREGSLGRKFAFNTFMCQNAPSITAGNTTKTNAVNLSAGYAAGTTSLAIDGVGTPVAGEWCTIAGDMTPQRVISYGSNVLVISPGLATAVDNNAVVTTYTAGAVNLTAGYASGHVSAVAADGFSVSPKSGQLITFGTGTAKYGAIGTPTTTSVLVDRPLAAAISNNDLVGIGPAGEYNFGFHRNALALVSRPLATPAAGTGALSYVASYNGLGVRVTITYNGTTQGHLVTVDLLCGVKTLDTDLGCVMYA